MIQNSNDRPAGSAQAAQRLLVNFVVMSLCFAVNHGTVTTVISLATVQLGVGAGSVSLAILYAGYVLTALLLSSSIIGATGRKWGLVLGAALYCLYVGSFFLAINMPAAAVTNGTSTGVGNSSSGSPSEGGANASCVPAPQTCSASPGTPPANRSSAVKNNGTRYCACTHEWTLGNGVVSAGSALGGVAAGFLWSAQGAYFSRNAERYAMARGMPTEQATSTFSGIFAGLFLFFELVMKGCTYFITSQQALYSLLSLSAVASTLAMATIMPMEQEAQAMPAQEVAGKAKAATAARSMPHRAGQGQGNKATAALRLLLTDPKVLLMLPTQAVFGFSAAMMNAWVNGFLVPHAHGKQYTGSLSALTTLVAWLTSQLGSWYAGKPVGRSASCLWLRGKPLVMLLGDVAFGCLALLVTLCSCATLGQWRVTVLLFVLQGLGRGVFESTNKATFADFFPGDKAVAAFSNQIVLSGAPSVAFFFIIPALKCMADRGQATMGTVVLATALLAVVTYLAASRHARREWLASQSLTARLMQNAAKDEVVRW